MRRFACVLTILLSLSCAVVAQEKTAETKEPETAAEQDFRKALEISASLKPMIEKESNKIREQRRKAQQKP